jgi:hypothetical protein
MKDDLRIGYGLPVLIADAKPDTGRAQLRLAATQKQTSKGEYEVRLHYLKNTPFHLNCLYPPLFLFSGKIPP